MDAPSCDIATANTSRELNITTRDSFRWCNHRAVMFDVVTIVTQAVGAVEDGGRLWRVLVLGPVPILLAHGHHVSKHYVFVLLGMHARILFFVSKLCPRREW